MPQFRDVRDALVVAMDTEILDDEEFVMLYKLYESRNDYDYKMYSRFDLDQHDDATAWSTFRFFKKDILRLKDVLRIPDFIITYNRLKVDGIEALCIFLKRMAYPCRYVDMIPLFGRAVPDYSIIVAYVLEHIYDNFGHLLNTFDQPIFAVEKLEEYCRVINKKGAPLPNCFGFIDGTVRPICRPGRNQRVVYNGHKKVHALKFQSVALPNGLIGNLFGPIEGRHHDCYLLRESHLLQTLEQYAFDSNGAALCLYGDPAYPLRVHLQAPFKEPRLQPIQQEFNTRMSRTRVTVEWLFGDISSWFAFLDFKKNLKLNLSAVGKMYLVCALLTNARTCLYGNLTSDYFGCEPPILEEYFV